MDNVTISTTNTKGQFVIPYAIRKKLGINQHVPIQVTLKGNIIYLTPIKDLITINDSDQSYLDILKKTQGSWKDVSVTSTAKRQLELGASQNRKQAW